MDFVPAEHRHGKVPCRHILLSESGETIDSLSKAGAKEKQLETALRDWLVTTITKLDSPTAA